MARFLSFMTLLSALLMSQAMPSGEAFAQGRQQEENACGRDATRLCKPVINDGDMAILACLRMHRDRLRPVCTRFLQEKGQLN